MISLSFSIDLSLGVKLLILKSFFYAFVDSGLILVAYRLEDLFGVLLRN